MFTSDQFAGFSNASHPSSVLMYNTGMGVLGDELFADVVTAAEGDEVLGWPKASCPWQQTLGPQSP